MLGLHRLLPQLLLSLVWAVLVLPVSVLASETAPSEPLLRAAYVFNFLRFTEWPASNQADLTLCIHSSNATQAVAMEGLNGRSIRERRVRVVRWFSKAACDAVYIDSPNDSLALAEARDLRGVLTIGGYPEFVQGGGILALVVEGDRLRFDTHIGILRASGLKLSPQLLQLARRTLN